MNTVGLLGQAYSTVWGPRGMQLLARDESSVELDRGTSLIRNSARLGAYSRTMPRALRWSLGGGSLL